VNEYLRVGAGPEPVSGADQLPPQLLVIPDFAVVDDHDQSVLARHRLTSVLKVDDAEPRAPQSGRTVHI
jgi:hypothetical protein